MFSNGGSALLSLEMAVDLKLDQAGATRVSFPDRAVKGFDLTNGHLSFVTDGVFIEGLGLSAAPCEVSLFTDSNIVSRTYDGADWKETEFEQVRLRDVCEWDVIDAALKISGFDAVSGRWVEILIPAFSGTLKAAS